MGTYKSLPQIRLLGNHHGSETIVTVKFRGLVSVGLPFFYSNTEKFHLYAPSASPYLYTETAKACKDRGFNKCWFKSLNLKL